MGAFLTRLIENVLVNTGIIAGALKVTPQQTSEDQQERRTAEEKHRH